MKNKKAVAKLLSIALISSMLLAGCGKSGTNETQPPQETAQTQSEDGDKKNVTIKWLSMGPGEDSWEGLTKPILEEYEKETGVHVDAEFYPFKDFFDVIETKASSGNSDFDVMSVDVTFISKYANSGYLYPLDEFFSEEERKEWDDASYNAGVWDGKLYAAPENTSTQELYYNKTLLDQAGIELPENDANHRLTYEQVADLAKQGLEKLDPDGSKGLIGFDFQQVSRVYQMNMLPNSMGGKNINESGDSLKGVIDTEPWIKAMTWYQNLVNEGIASKGYTAEELGDQFTAGNMLFIIGGTWTPMNLKTDDTIESTYAPCFEGYEDKVATSTGSWYFGVNSKSENIEAAADFAKWFTLGKGNDMWLKANGDVPSRIEKQQEIVNNPDSPKDMVIAAYEAGHTAYPRAVTPYFGEYSTILDEAWEDIRNGSDVKSSIDNAIEKFDSAVLSQKN